MPINNIDDGIFSIVLVVYSSVPLMVSKPLFPCKGLHAFGMCFKYMLLKKENISAVQSKLAS